MTEQMEITPREIKFRAWDGKKYHYFTALSGLYGVLDPIVQQFTGLKDNNGKEIYEGDILKFFDKVVATVVWKDFGGWSFNWIDQRYRVIRQQNPEPFFHNINLFEVIGNIFSDPELLKQLDNGMDKR